MSVRTFGENNDLYTIKNRISGSSLVVQWLRLHAPNAMGLGSIPGQGTRSDMQQPGSSHATTQDPVY